jgi:hypothetical protein
VSRLHTYELLAAEILELTSSERLEKTASVTYNQNDRLETKLGEQLRKLASVIRDRANGDVTYADLKEYMERR